MALSIESPAAEELVRQIAAKTGESLTQAVVHALKERLEQLRSRRSEPDLVETLMAISERCSALPDLDPHSSDEILGYADDGTFR